MQGKDVSYLEYVVEKVRVAFNKTTLVDVTKCIRKNWQKPDCGLQNEKLIQQTIYKVLSPQKEVSGNRFLHRQKMYRRTELDQYEYVGRPSGCLVFWLIGQPVSQPQ